MQSYPLALSPKAATTIQTPGRTFVYESGVTDPPGADARIVIKPNNGNEIILRPGQGFSLAAGDQATSWNVRAYKDDLPLAGIVIIGAGEFKDGTFKIDSTSGVIAVRVDNTPENRLPVELDPATEKALKENPVMSYTHSRTVNGQQYVAVQVLAPAENVRGVIVEDCTMLWDGSSNLFARLVAKAGAAPVAQVPASTNGPADGDMVIPYIKQQLASINAPTRRIAIPAGCGLWVWSENPSARVVTLLTIL